GLSGARKLWICGGCGILFWEACRGFEAAGSGADRRHGQRPEVFSAEQSYGRASAAQSGSDANGRGRKNHSRGRGEREEDAARLARVVSAERSRSLFF